MSDYENEAQALQAQQASYSQNVMNYPNTRVQQSILILQQAQSIRDDKALMGKIRKYLREENARVLATLADLYG